LQLVRDQFALGAEAKEIVSSPPTSNRAASALEVPQAKIQDYLAKIGKQRFQQRHAASKRSNHSIRPASIGPLAKRRAIDCSENCTHAQMGL